MNRSSFALSAVSAAFAAALAGSPLAAVAATAIVKIDGSSTVYPITEAVAEEFQKMKKGAVNVTVGISGTGGGFKKFCLTKPISPTPRARLPPRRWKTARLPASSTSKCRLPTMR